MLKRDATTGLLLGLAASILIVATTASAYLYRSRPVSGQATIVGGFGGPAPSNVPADAKPQIEPSSSKARSPARPPSR